MSDVRSITDIITTYFDGLYDGDTHKLGRAFHPSARLYTLVDGVLRETPRGDWLAAVEGRPAPRAQGLARTDRIVALDVTDAVIASAKVECSIHPKYFVDYLTLAKTAEHGWQIVAKTFRTELRA